MCACDACPVLAVVGTIQELRIPVIGHDMFPFTELEDSQNYQVNLSHFITLFNGGEIRKNQPSLFPFYDFSIIPVEFIRKGD